MKTLTKGLLSLIALVTIQAPLFATRYYQIDNLTGKDLEVNVGVIENRQKSHQQKHITAGSSDVFTFDGFGDLLNIQVKPTDDMKDVMHTVHLPGMQRNASLRIEIRHSDRGFTANVNDNFVSAN